MAKTEQVRWEGPEQLRPLLVPVDSIQPHPRNPRRGDLDLIEESLRTFGQQKPIVVQESSANIVAGNHLYRGGLERMRWTHVAAVVSPLSDDEAGRYLLMDNRASDVGTYDMPTLATILGEMHDRGSLAGTGYSPDGYDDILASANAVAETARQDFQGDYAETEEERARREAARAAAPVMREVVLLLSPAEHARLGGHVRVLRKELGLETVTATIVETVKRAAEALAREE